MKSRTSMISSEVKSIEERLIREIEAAGPDYGQGRKAPTTLALGRIEVIPAVFQQRRVAKWSSKRHVEELVRALKSQGKPLDPLVVIDTGTRYVLVDGHHRAEAYRVASWNRPVPVRVMYGDFEAALLCSLTGNSKDKLAMSRQEKHDAAWRFVCRKNVAMSKSKIAAAAGISIGSVTSMRAVLREIEADDLGDPSAMSWDMARRTVRDLVGGEYDEDEHVSAKLDRCNRAFPKKDLMKPARAFIRAMEALSPEDWAEVLLELGVRSEDDEELDGLEF